MEKLKFINEQLTEIGIPYEFGEWTAEVQYPYFVGDLTEIESMTEDGSEQSTLILTGTHRGSYLDLETIKDKIKKHFPAVGGLRAQLDGGAIAVYYGGAFYVPTGEADLKRMQINLEITEWRS